jgi:hypothetical protein
MRFSPRTLLQCTLLLAMALTPALAVSCAHSTSIGGSDFNGGSSGGGSGGGGGGGSGLISTPMGGSGGGGFVPASGGGSKCAKGVCQDFASTAIMDPKGMPTGDPSTLFGAGGTGSMQNGPCLVEPADGALYPKNWLRPRVYWKVTDPKQNLFEVRLHSDGEAHDLVVYTTNTYWAMDKTIWQTIAFAPPGPMGMPAAKDGNLIGAPIIVTVRGISSTGGTPAISNNATITIAPAIADGALVYWTTSSFANETNSTTLQGFTVGDEGTTTALTTQEVQQPVRAQLPPPANLAPATFNPVFCIGCHTATPDGKFVSFTSQWPWAVALASIDTTAGAPAVGSPPTWLTPGAASNLSPNINGYYAPPSVNQVMMGIQTFSPGHYQTGDRKLVAAIGAAWNQTEAQIMAVPMSPGSATGVVSQLAWFDLEYTGTPPVGMPYNPWSSGMLTSPLPVATPCSGLGGGCATSTGGAGWGIIARTGDSNSAGGPNWSHNVSGTDAIAYGSTNLGTKDGRMDCELSGSNCTSDVYVVPFNGGMGGAATPLPGASKPDQSEYYPAWSPDDQLIAFNRVPTGTSMYNANAADIYVVPYKGGMGGTEQALKSNDPVACTGATPGTVQNTWPKWAPNPLDPTTKKPVPQKDTSGNTYYWITFSSTRSPQAPVDTGNQGKRKQQLYVAGIVVDSTGNISTFAPIYLWNQDFTVNNLIPAWGEFSIPPGSIPPPAPTAL